MFILFSILDIILKNMAESSPSNESYFKKGIKLGNDFFKGSKAFNITEGYKYAIKYAKSGAGENFYFFILFFSYWIN